LKIKNVSTKHTTLILSFPDAEEAPEVVAAEEVEANVGGGDTLIDDTLGA